MKQKNSPTIQVERWKTVTNRNSKREDHYFVSRDGSTPVYAFGYNPDLFSKSDIKKIVKMIKVKS